MPAFAGRTTVLETLASYGSSCPLPVHKFAWAFGSSHSWLTKVPFWTCQPLRSIPITGTSSLLRADPPLSAAPVLSASWVLHLRLFPCLGSRSLDRRPEFPWFFHGLQKADFGRVSMWWRGLRPGPRPRGSASALISRSFSGSHRGCRRFCCAEQ